MAGFHPRIALNQTEGALENGALLLAAPARDLSDMPVPVPLSEATRIAPPTLILLSRARRAESFLLPGRDSKRAKGRVSPWRSWVRRLGGAHQRALGWAESGTTRGNP